jgi:hypothetical protein
MDMPTIIKLAELADLVSLGLDGLLWREPMAMSQELHDRLSGLQWRPTRFARCLGRSTTTAARGIHRGLRCA